METKDAEFLQRLLSMFRIEAKEHLNVIGSWLATMSKGDSAYPAEMIETVYREAHSLKGAARSVNLVEIVDLCQVMEDLFAALKRERINLSVQTCDVLQQTVDYCYRLVDGEEMPASGKSEIRKLITLLDYAASANPDGREPISLVRTQGQPTVEAIPAKIGSDQESTGRKFTAEKTLAKPVEPPAPDITEKLPHAPILPGTASPDTVRIDTVKLDALLLQAEEMISVKLTVGQRAAELRDLCNSFNLWKKKRPGMPPAGGTTNHHSDGPLLPDPFISFFNARLMTMVKAAEYDYRFSAAMIDKMLDDMKKALMLPISSLLDICPRLIRDLSRAAGKKITLTTKGRDIEVDRRVLEEMKNPLVHLIRNCVDHGIEPVAEREQKGKPPEGAMTIDVLLNDNQISIAIADDGAGIDVAKIKYEAVKHAVITREEGETLGDQEAMQLIFRSGVTTSPLITDISGRGLGLAIVREKVEKLSGTVTVESQIDEGTTFRIVVPLTLATFRGTLVRVADQIFVLPSGNVERVARVERETIRTIENRETMVFEHCPVSLVRLSDILKMKVATAGRVQDEGPVQVIILGLAEQRIAFAVDEVLREQEVMVKPLGSQLSRVRNISGATVLANGKVAPVLNVADLLKSATKNGSSFLAGENTVVEKTASVLVVEDSITARALLKNILESAGYQVQTAVDGLDGLAILKSRTFDIVISDVEMPRMNGFELTSKIRSDKKLSQLPVVLVTALESREDRERGIDVGASAYIVKSSFDQSNLLEVVERLI